ncbi:MAG TPA: hypothetical protein PLD23_15655 [Armatimonadota bacterium]|nr:hypothetical protein [Armatimonadota bacterium]
MTAEPAEEIVRPKLGDLKGGWIETTRDFCAEAEATRRGPAWNVMVKLGPKDRPLHCVPDRSAFVDPWPGEIICTAQCEGASPVPAPGGNTAAMPAPAGAVGSESAALRRARRLVLERTAPAPKP